MSHPLRNLNARRRAARRMKAWDRRNAWRNSGRMPGEFKVGTVYLSGSQAAQFHNDHHTPLENE